MIGNGWSAFLSIALIPFYIQFLGIEVYGLIGFFTAMQSLLLLLDMGLAATVTRELARLSANSGTEDKIRDLVRTLELFYWVLAAVVFIIVFLISPLISLNWLNATNLSPSTIQHAVSLMGVTIAVRMLFSFYSGGLLGMQRQVLLNSVKILVGTAQSAGVILILWLVSPTIGAFFLWHAIVGSLGAGSIAIILWLNLPGNSRPQFRPSLFQNIWRFAAGMSLISLLSTMELQMDKVILSKMLTLEEFGCYTLASLVAMGLSIVLTPVFSALYPRFTELVSINDEQGLRNLYHKSCQLLTVIAMPLSIVISFFSLDLLQIWTQNDMVSRTSSTLLSILIIGTAINGMMYMPYALQLAYGWTKLAIYSNTIAIIVLIPTLVFAVHWFGAVGAACIWIILNVCIVAINVPIIHKKFLRGELKRWIVEDIGLPSSTALIVATFSWLIMPTNLSEIGRFGWIILTLVSCLLVTLFSAPIIFKIFREAVVDHFKSESMHER